MITNSKNSCSGFDCGISRGSLGAIAMRSTESSPDRPHRWPQQTARWTRPSNLLTNAIRSITKRLYNAASSQPVPNEFKTAEEQDAYKIGFADGFPGSYRTACNVGAFTRTAIRLKQYFAGAVHNVSITTIAGRMAGLSGRSIVTS